MATALADPVADLLLVVLLVGALAVMGWRASAMWWMIIASLGWVVVADVAALVQSASPEGFRPGGWIDAAWMIGCAVLAPAAWVRDAERPPREVGDAALMAVPQIFQTWLAAQLLARTSVGQRL